MKRSNNFINNLQICSEKITYNDFDINESMPLEKQLLPLQQDILQIGFGKRFVVDVGWYPEMDPKGSFVVRAIQDYDWMNPLSQEKCHRLIDLKKAIESVVILVEKMKTISDLPSRNIFPDEE